MATVYKTIPNFIKFVTTHPQAFIIVQDRQYLNFFTDQLNKYYLEKKASAWRGPNIYTIDVWAANLWNWLQIHSQELNIQLPKLLNPVSEKLILGKLVHKWNVNPQHEHKFLNTEGTAIEVSKCWRLLCQYNCLPKLPDYAEQFEPQFSSKRSVNEIVSSFINRLQGKTSSDYRLNSDHQFFIDIVEEYCQLMKQNFLLSGRLLHNSLIHFLTLLIQQQPAIEIPYLNKEMVFANFIENTYPQLDSVLNSLLKMGVNIKRLTFKNSLLDKFTLVGTQKDESVRSPFDSLEDELAWAVNYIKPKLTDPNYRAALVSQNLDENFYLTIDKYANPQVLFVGSSPQRAYKYPGGSLLSKTPMSADFYNLLQLAGGSIKRAPLLNLIQNSFLYKAQAEFNERSRLYKSICSDRRSEYTLKDLYELAQHCGCFYLAKLVSLTAQFSPDEHEHMRQAFCAFRKSAKNRKKKNLLESSVWQHKNWSRARFPLSLWISYSRTLIQMWISYGHALHSAPTSALAAATYMSKLRSFYTIATYSDALNSLSFTDFRRYLRLGLHGVRLAPLAAAPGAERFNILNIRKALRHHFSEIVLVGFNAENFPQPVSYPGFIPQPLLIELGWPRAAASLSLKETLNNLEALRHCADKIVITFSNTIKKNDKQQPSSVGLESLVNEAVSSSGGLKNKLNIYLTSPEELMTPLNALNSPDTLTRYGLYPLDNRDALSEQRSDAPPPPARLNNIRDGIKSFRGGVQVISEMANCPLQALLIRRLECAGSEEETKNGLDTKLDRGNILHECLKLFWEKFNSSANPQAGSSYQQLKKLAAALSEDDGSAQTLESTIRSIVHSVLQNPEYSRLSKHILENEENLLTEKLCQWMVNYELKHGDFDTVKCEEKVLLKITPQSSEHLENPNLKLVCAGTIDRINEVKDGNNSLGRIIIDYKTGNPGSIKVKAWDPEQNYEVNNLRRNFQLPLYAFESEEKDQCMGISFALLNKANVGKGKFANIKIAERYSSSRSGADKDTIELPWDEFQNKCHDLFSRLAQEYLEGSCRRTLNKTLCRDCAFAHLCRVSGQDQEKDSAESN
ncbi:MAG: PD-(D/E)XK nuclease family protein [Candidatus Bruticola sp.]